MKLLSIFLLVLTSILFLPSKSSDPEFKYSPVLIHKVKLPSDKRHVKQAASRGMEKQYIGSFKSTSYNLTRNRTASGTRTRIGVVAVDPDVIPLGTRLYIEGYGLAIAEDTGAVIKGKIIDVWLPGEEAWEWGRKQVRVWIVR